MNYLVLRQPLPFLVVGLVALGGCSSSSPSNDTPTAATTSSTAAGGSGGQGGAAGATGATTGGGAGEAGSGGSGGSGSVPDGGGADAPHEGGKDDAGPDTSGAFYPPQAKIMYVGQGPSDGLALVAGNLILPTSAGLSAKWIAVVKNGGTDVICSVGLNADFKSAAGDVLASVRMNIDGETYLSGTSSSNCLGPGKTGVGLWTQLGTTPIDPNAIDRIEHGFPGAIVPNATLANRATLSNVRIEPGPFSGYVVKGTATATQAVRYVFINAYPRNAAGRPLDQLVISNAALAAGTPWDFTTTSTKDQFTEDYLTFTYTFP
jgi:hypothetical protein